MPVHRLVTEAEEVRDLGEHTTPGSGRDRIGNVRS